MISDMKNPGQAAEPPRSEHFLDVFVVRSFRESHLDSVIRALESFVDKYESRYWKCKPFRLVNTGEDIGSGGVLGQEITSKVNKSTIVIVILDGLRHNVLFELGYLFASRKPFILLKHSRWGPQFTELDLVASDIKGMVVKEYDHERDPDGFRSLLESEFYRCENEFMTSFDTHAVLPLGRDNLVTYDWAFETGG